MKMKSFDFLWWFIGGGLIGSLLFGDLARPKKHEEDIERERVRKQEQSEEKRFDTDYAFVCEKIGQRDIEIYTIAEKWDRELLADVERLALPTNDANEYRVKLETKLKRRLNRHIEECVRFRSRIREWRSGASARWLWADIYQTKCDCDCCNKN